MNELLDKACAVKRASKKLARQSAEEKNKALAAIANALEQYTEEILAANLLDVEAGRAAGMSEGLIDRLSLNSQRVKEIAEGVRSICLLDDPIGEVIERFTRPNGLIIEKVRVPLGTIGMIYEARPNVTVDSAALALKSGNGVLLRGSGSAINSNKKIVQIIKFALDQTNIDSDCIALFEESGHAATREMMQLSEYLDVLIPRGGAGLIKSVVENAEIPVLETGVGNCHIFIDESAGVKMATEIAINAKTQRPSVCNAAETLLIHKNWICNARNLFSALAEKGVVIHGCEVTKSLYPEALAANEDDYKYEYLSPDLAVKIVDDIDEAILHIDKYGTKHTEAIITEDDANAKKFLSSVDASCVNHNASTRFTDGFQFGFGAEIGISTQKIHARGPLGLKEITIYKYIIHGNGQIRS